MTERPTPTPVDDWQPTDAQCDQMDILCRMIDEWVRAYAKPCGSDELAVMMVQAMANAGIVAVLVTDIERISEYCNCSATYNRLRSLLPEEPNE